MRKSKRIEIKGPIVSDSDLWIYEFFGIEATSPKAVKAAISEAAGQDIEIEINSGGGDVFAGSEIYTAIKEYAGNSTVKIVGVAASMASVVAMGAKKVLMSPTAQMMMHNVSMYAEGDYRDMEHASEILKNANETIANAYRLKSGLSQEELLKIMNKETWLSPQRAVELKLADEIMFTETEGIRLAAAYQSGLLPPSVINTFKQNPNLAKKKCKSADFFNAQAQIELLKLGGKV